MIKKIIIYSVISVFIFGTSQAALKSDIKDKSPIVGTWKWTREVNNCTEIYKYKNNGTIHLISGDEITTVKYKLISPALPYNRYKLIGTITSDNGGMDCADSNEDGTGTIYEVWIEFNIEKDEHMVCSSEGGTECMGPLFRQTKSNK